MSIADLPRTEARASGSELADKGAPFTARVMAFACVLGVAISTALVLTAADQSISLTDEGLYLLLVDDPEASIRSGTGFHLILSPLFELVDKSIVEWRLVRAFLDIGADVLFGASLLSYLRSRSPQGVFAGGYVGVTLVSGITLLGFISWSWSVNGFGYNEAGAIFITLIAALFLQTIKSDSDASGRIILCSVGLGMLLVAQLATRWTAGTAVLAGLVVATLIYTTRRKAITLFAAAAAGMAFAAVALHLFVLDLRTGIAGIVAGTADVSQGAHSLDVIFAQYARSLWLGLGFSVFFAFALLAGAVGVHFLQREDSNPILPWALFGFAVLFVAFGQRYVLGTPRAYTINGWSAVLLGLALVAIGVRSSQSLFDSGVAEALRTAALPGLLILIPFAAALGTDVLILLIAIFSSPLWAGALVICEHKSGFRGRIGYLLAVGLALLAASTPIFVYETLSGGGPWASGEQNVAVEQGRFSGLQVDVATHDFLVELDELRLRLGPEPTVLPLWSRPGITFALDGTGIGFPWYAWRDRAVAAATIEGACAEDGFVPAGQIVLVQEVNRPDLGPVSDALSTCGINFPDDFTLIDTVVAPGDLELRIFLDDRSG